MDIDRVKTLKEDRQRYSYTDSDNRIDTCPSSKEEDWERALQFEKFNISIPRTSLDIWYEWGYEEGFKGKIIRRYKHPPDDEHRFRDSWHFKEGLKDGSADRLRQSLEMNNLP